MIDIESEEFFEALERYYSKKWNELHPEFTSDEYEWVVIPEKNRYKEGEGGIICGEDGRVRQLKSK